VTATTEEEVLSGILPQVTIDKIVLESSGQNTESTQDDNTLKITLFLTIKEILDNSFLGSWFNEINFKKYITIDIVQSRNASVTEALSFSNDMIGICNQFHTKGAVDLEDAVTKAFAFVTGNTKLSQIYGILEQNTVLKRVSLTDSSNKITEYPSYLNTEGQRVYEIPYKTSFQLDTLNPEHLSYFVVCSLNIQQICTDYNIDYNLIKNDIEEIGRVYSEIVVRDFNVVGESYLYIDQNNSIWNGPIHESPDGTFRTGNEETADSRNVTRVAVQNSKVQDFRNIQEIERRIFDFTNIGTTSRGSAVSLEQTLNKVTKVQGVDDYKPRNKPSKFTNLFISRDFQNNIKFFFGIDFNNIIKENSKFGYLINKNLNTLNEFLKNTKILDLKILRRRINNNFKLSNSSAKFEYDKFDEQPDEIILQTNDQKDIKQIVFLDVDNDISSIREVNLALNRTYSYMRYFTGVDKTMVDVTDGIYQYYIELEIEDKIIDYLVDTIKNLETAKNSIVEYYAKVSTPTMKKFLAESQDPHIQSPSEYSKQPDVVDYGYDPVSNKFSPQLIGKIKRAYGNRGPWRTAPLTFVSVLSSFSDNNTKENNTIISNALTNYLNPDTANPSSILKTIEMFDYLISNISNVAGVTRDDTSTNISSASGSKINKTFKITKFFGETSEIVNSNLIRSYGIEYLSKSFETNTDGLTSVTYDDFFARISNEMLKYFNSENPAINFGSSDKSDKQIKYSFITPVRIDFLNNSIITTPTLEKISYANQNIEYFFNNRNRFDLAASMQADILNLKLDVTGKSVYRTVKSDFTSRGRNNLISQRNNTINTSKKVSDLLSSYSNASIYPYSLATLSNASVSIGNLTDGGNFRAAVSTTNTVSSSAIISQFISELTSDTLRSRQNNSNFYSSNTERQQAKTPTNLPDDYVQEMAKIQYNVNFEVSRPSSNAQIFQSSNAPNQLNVSQVQFGSPPTSNTVQTSVLPEPLNKTTPNRIPCQLRGLIFKQQLSPSISEYSRYTSDYQTYIKNKVINYFNFEMIVEIEYLSDFERISPASRGIIMANRPIWRTLDKSVLDRFVDGRELLCRIKPYEEKNIFVQSNTEVEKNCYNKYFFLKTSEIRVAPPRIPVVNLDILLPFPDIEIPPAVNKPNNNFVDSRNIRQNTFRDRVGAAADQPRGGSPNQMPRNNFDIAEQNRNIRPGMTTPGQIGNPLLGAPQAPVMQNPVAPRNAPTIPNTVPAVSSTVLPRNNIGTIQTNSRIPRRR
jgi:hypothetical protein